MPVWRPALAEGVLLIGLALLVHALVLVLVFPGYYRPLWPHHSDFYIPPALAQSALGYEDYLRFPRPIAAMFLSTIGWLGVRGGILAVILVVHLNLVLTASLVRRVAGARLSWGFLSAFALYACFVFAHPYFYVFATYDAISQASFLFLVMAAWCLFKYSTAPHSRYLVSLAVLVLLAFLTKETYGLSALFLTGLWSIARRRRGAIRASLPTLITGMALVVALWINAINVSPFTGAQDHDTSPYRIDFSPSSLVHEWTRYAADGLNAYIAGSLAVLAIGTWILMRARDSRRRWFPMMLILAGALAWLPNAALPNHYNPGYSWNGAYLLFTPVLFIAPFWDRGWPGRLCGAVAGALVIASAIMMRAPAGNVWILEQEARQRNLLQAMYGLTSSTAGQGARRILVTGIDFPFSPFDHALSLRSFAAVADTRFDVVAYAPRRREVPAFPSLEAEPNGVRFIAPAEVDLAVYTHVWGFRTDGSLVTQVADPARYASASGARAGFSAWEMLVYPKLIDVFDGESESAATNIQQAGYRYLACGAALLSYDNLAGAQGCLTRSLKLLPENPYPAFFLGQVYEKQGHAALAHEFYTKAASLDDARSVNPAFRQGIERTRIGGSSPSRQ